MAIWHWTSRTSLFSRATGGGDMLRLLRSHFISVFRQVESMHFSKLSALRLSSRLMYPNVDVYMQVSLITAFGCLGLHSGAYGYLVPHVLSKMHQSILPILQMLHQKNTDLLEALGPLVPQIPLYTSKKMRIRQLRFSI